MITTSVNIEMIKGEGTLNSAYLAGRRSEFMSVISSDIGVTANRPTSPKLVYPFYLGHTRFSEKNNVYISHGAKAPYFVGRYVSDENGNFSDENGNFSDENGNFEVAYKFTLTYTKSGKNAIVIVFDEENGGHPKSIVVDGGLQTIADNDTQYEIGFISESGMHQIEINNWNKPNEPLIITRMFASLELDLDYGRLLEYNVRIADRASVSAPQYGIISNSGTVTVQDTDGTILDCIQHELLSHNKVEVFVCDTDDTIKEKERIALMYTDNIQYDNENSEVTITIKDDIENLQKINITPLYYIPEESRSMTYKELYDYLHYETAGIHGIAMLKYDELDDATKKVLSEGIVVFPYLEESTLWGAWEKLCVATLGHMYKNADDVIVFKRDI